MKIFNTALITFLTLTMLLASVEDGIKLSDSSLSSFWTLEFEDTEENKQGKDEIEQEKLFGKTHHTYSRKARFTLMHKNNRRLAILSMEEHLVEIPTPPPKVAVSDRI